MVLICGDFNINSLPESENLINHMLKQHEKNSEYLLAAENEYHTMLKIFERMQPGSIIDHHLVSSTYGSIDGH